MDSYLIMNLIQVSYPYHLYINQLRVTLYTDDESLAKKYAAFLKQFQNVLDDAGIGLGADIGGWGILKYTKDYTDSNLTVYTSMEPTYNGSNAKSGKSQNYVCEEVKHLEKKTLRTGVGSMLTKTPPDHTWNFDWTQKDFTDFLNFLKKNVSVPHVDVYRADLDNDGYDTEPWFYSALKDFVKE